MTDQEVFDFGYLAILNQGSASVDDESEMCYYRHPDGIRKCVAGHFINDEEYSEIMEGKVVYCRPEYGPYTDDDLKVQKLFELKNINLELINAMQKAHDSASEYSTFVFQWKYEMKNIAKRFGLSTDVIKD